MAKTRIYPRSFLDESYRRYKASLTPRPADYFSWEQNPHDFGAYFTPEEYLLWCRLLRQCRQVGEGWRVGIPSSVQAMTPHWKLLIQKHPRRLDADTVLHFFERLQIVGLLVPVEGALRHDGILVCQFVLNPHRILAKKLPTKERGVITVTDTWAKLPRLLQTIPRHLLAYGRQKPLLKEIRQRFALSECPTTVLKRLIKDPSEYSRGLGLLMHGERGHLLPCWPGLSAAHPYSLEEKYPSNYA